MKNLFDKIKIIDFKYKTLREKEKFNLFKILRKYNDEVNLHSRFISELLNPKGTHGLEDTFLKLFLKIINYGEFSISKKANVFYEKHIGEINALKTQGGQLDLLIENVGKHPIIIENKIHARDQENQLLRYKNYKQNSKIYYLTLQGVDPTPYSLGTVNLNEINCISYKDEIRNWIKLCIEKASQNPELRESLVQYLNLINELIGETSIMEERIELIELLSKDKNILAASKIANNWVHVKWHTEFDFWNELELKINSSSDYQITEIQKYSSENLSSVIHNRRNKNPWYGILFKFYNKQNIDFCIFIERGTDNLYFGLLMLNENGKRIESNNLTFIKISEKIKNNVEWQNISWLGVLYLEPKINLELFNSEPTLMLVNKKYREKYIEDNWKRIESFIRICLKEITATNN